LAVPGPPLALSHRAVSLVWNGQVQKFGHKTTSFEGEEMKERIEILKIVLLLALFAVDWCLLIQALEVAM
jgi:hypothetical protein